MNSAQFPRKGGLMDAIEIAPPLERLTPESQELGHMWCDVFRMRVPGGWLVTTVVETPISPKQCRMALSTVFVADPDGTWLCTGKGAA